MTACVLLVIGCLGSVIVTLPAAARAATGLVPTTATVAPVAAPSSVVKGGYVPVGPTRLLDTRTGGGPVAAGATVGVTVDGRAGIPATGISAVAINLTVTNARSHGYVTVFAGSAVRPATSNLNFVAGQTVANTAVVPVGTDGRIQLFNGSPGAVDLLVDVSGYFRSGVVTDPGGFTPVRSTRILDTRVGKGAPQAPIGRSTLLQFHATGTAGIPATDVAAVVLNLTVTHPSTGGHITVGTDLLLMVLTSTVNFAAGQTVANEVEVPVAVDGSVDLVNFSGGSVDVVADVAGFIRSGTVSAPGGFVVGNPFRVVDTRKPPTTAHVPAGGTVAVPVTTGANLPQPGVAAVAINVTVTNTAAHGYITAYPGGSVPRVSTLNFGTGQTVAHSAVVALGADGKIQLFNGSGGPVDLIVDVLGYVLAISVPGAPTWMASTLDHLQGGPVDVACPTTQFCLAVDSTGSVLTFNGTTWSAPSTAAPRGFITLSCPTTTFCIAVDQSGIAYRYDGSTWSATAEVGNDPAQVSCPSVRFCLAVDYQHEVSFFDGTAWTTPVQPVATDGAIGGPTHVSCLSATFCMGTDYSGHTYRFDGKTWIRTLVTDDAPLNAVSCTSPDFCLALGDKAYEWNGKSWGNPLSTMGQTGAGRVSCASPTFCVMVADQRASVFDGTGWSITRIDDTSALITSVSCPVSGQCVALSNSGRAFRLSSGHWDVGTVVDEIGGVLTSVSCPTATFCVAVNKYGKAWKYDGSNWTTFGTIAPHVDWSMTAVSCASPMFCVAVEGRHVVTYDGHAWAAPVQIWNGAGNLNAISCPTALFCIGVDDLGFVTHFDGSAWSVPAQVRQGPFASVSCRSSSFCVAVTSSGDAWTFDGSQWGRNELDLDTGFTTVSCASTSFCVALDARHFATVFDGAGWSILRFVQTNFDVMASVSCPSTTACVAVDEAGNSFDYDGSTWSAPNPLEPNLGGYNLTGLSVSCPTTSFCVAVDNLGHAFVGRR